MSFPVASWLRKHTRVYDSGASNIYVDCPVCGGKKKLSISKTKLIGRCFRCDEGGHGGAIWTGRAGLPKLVSLIGNLSMAAAYDEIRRYDAKYDAPTNVVQVNSDVRFPEKITSCQDLPATHPANQLLADRDCSHISDTSYACTAGRYRGRVILPCRWFGELVGWEAKSYSGHTRKSLFPEWFHTGQNIYTSKYWDDSKGFAVITESTLDAECIGWNACGLYGCALRDGQLERLIELRERGIRTLIWFLDHDARSKQLGFISKKTAALFDNYAVHVPKGHDPCSLGREKCLQLIAEAKEFGCSLEFVEFENETRTHRRKPPRYEVQVGHS